MDHLPMTTMLSALLPSPLAGEGSGMGGVRRSSEDALP
jgi:hypothetical protein